VIVLVVCPANSFPPSVAVNPEICKLTYGLDGSLELDSIAIWSIETA
jgi:hypothetical protein